MNDKVCRHCRHWAQPEKRDLAEITEHRAAATDQNLEDWRPCKSGGKHQGQWMAPSASCAAFERVTPLVDIFDDLGINI